MKYSNGNLRLSPNKLYLNTLQYENTDFVLSNLTEDFNGNSKGGNSNVFTLYNPNTEEEFAIKFCKYDIKKINKFSEKRILRFSREIEALETSRDNGLDRIIDIKFQGSKQLKGMEFNYYVMEKADYDLTDYLNKNELSVQQKVNLCLDILEGIGQLHSLNIYHRDIKPDNILHTNEGWKIGDLGLVDYRDTDFEIDEHGEKIGPIGWLSPEAANKFLCEGKGNPYSHDCELNYNSDIFQLGKLFWYVFQGNIPIGQVIESDFKVKDKELFDILFNMLSYSKSRRYNLDDLQIEFESRSKFYAV